MTDAATLPQPGEPIQLTRKDFVSDQEVRWCPGCGDYSILAQTQKVMPDFGYPKENIVFISGNVSYDPENHHRMQLLRQAKIAGIAADIPPLEVFGPAKGDLLILGWGSTYGAIRSAVERLQSAGKSIAHAHLRYLNPFPSNTEDVLRSYRRVLIPEVNLGQLLLLIRAKYLIDAVGYDRVRGKPFRIAEIVAEAERILKETP